MISRPTVLLGVTGGIAAYKAVELLRGLQKADIDVRVIMTPTATRFVGPLTFETLSGRSVSLDAVGVPRLDSGITHVEEARAADLLVVAPATANTLAKMTHGIADNLLLGAYLAFRGPVVVAPAMNVEMWNHPATRRNLERLRADGVVIVEPGVGELACGVYGSGRMAEPAVIVVEIRSQLEAVLERVVPAADCFRGMKVIVTAGGTREPIDAVRYIGNRSSGKMGYALARAAVERGAIVELVEANVELPPVPGARLHSAPTASLMCDKVLELLPSCEVLLMAAAVADYQPLDCTAEGKIGKSQEHMLLTLSPTVDILQQVAARRTSQLVVGFAAEYGLEGLERARSKLGRKSLDMIVFNDISRSDIGFGSEYNEVLILSGIGEVKVEKAPKETVAAAILDEVARALSRRDLPAGPCTPSGDTLSSELP